MSSGRSNGFKDEEIVFGMVTGYPWWPGFISDKKSKRQYIVTFFGDFSYAPLPDKNIKRFKEGLCKIDKNNEDLKEAVESARRVHNGESTIEDEHKKMLRVKRKGSRNKIKNNRHHRR